MKVNFQKYQKFAYFTADIFRQVMVWLPAMWKQNLIIFDWVRLYVDGLKNYFVVIDYIFHNFTQIIEFI